ncbi:MAG: hypothetical protein K6B14_10280, partial [Lachnospiraceae bacterium]|nr:hypothetical protein [Lachnospiraceae bacterium]
MDIFYKNEIFTLKTQKEIIITKPTQKDSMSNWQIDLMENNNLASWVKFGAYRPDENGLDSTTPELYIIELITNEGYTDNHYATALITEVFKYYGNIHKVYIHAEPMK